MRLELLQAIRFLINQKTAHNIVNSKLGIQERIYVDARLCVILFHIQSHSPNGVLFAALYV